MFMYRRSIGPPIMIQLVLLASIGIQYSRIKYRNHYVWYLLYVYTILKRYKILAYKYDKYKKKVYIAAFYRPNIKQFVHI